MNREYIVVDSTVVVENTEGEKSVRQLTDNISEVLIQENLVEKMENDIEAFRIKKSRLANVKPSKFLPYCCSILAFSSLVFPKVLSMVPKFAALNEYTAHGGFTVGSAITVAGLGISCLLGPMIDFLIYFVKRDAFHEKISTDFVLDYLEKQIEVENEQLEILEEEGKVITDAKQVDFVKLSGSTIRFYNSLICGLRYLSGDFEKYCKLMSKGDIKDFEKCQKVKDPVIIRSLSNVPIKDLMKS